MFIRAFFLSALPLFAVATAIGSQPKPKPASQCDTGKLQCCQSVQNPGGNPSQQLQSLLVSLGIGNVGVPIGLTCDPIGVLVGINGNSCDAQAVCCDKNNFNGVVAVGCTPVDLNL